MNEKDGVQIKTEFLDKEGQIMLLKLSGFIDQSNSHLLEKTIKNGLDSSCYKLIFDFEDLHYMSSAGWGILVGEIKRFRQYNGDIKLVNLNSDLYQVYQMLEFYHIIAEYSSIKDALDSFSIDQDFNILANQTDEKVDEKQVKEKRRNKKTTGKKGKTTSEKVDEKQIKKKRISKKATGKKGKTTSKKREPAEQKDKAKDVDNSNKTGNDENIIKEKSNNSRIIEKEIEIEISDNSQDIEVQSNNKSADFTRGYVEFKPLSFEKKVDVKILPLPEKIRRIISQFPQLSILKIKKILQHPDFGNVNIGYFKLRSLLKDLDLDTKEKRFRFYRST
jgi:anti-sigma B factor antagonist